MKVYLQRGRDLQCLTDVESLVITTDNDVPVSVAALVPFSGQSFVVSCIDCPDFNRTLQQLGLDRTVFVVNPLASVGNKNDRFQS